MAEVNKMRNSILISIAVFIFFGISSYAQAITYGSGTYNSNLYSIYDIPATSSSATPVELLNPKVIKPLASTSSVIPIPTKTYLFNKPLKSKQDIKNLQTVLNYSLNSNLKVDGISGKNTIKAIKSFQKNNKLTSDGKVGPKTRTVLNTIIIK